MIKAVLFLSLVVVVCTSPPPPSANVPRTVTPSLVLNSFVPVVVDADAEPLVTNIDRRIFSFFFFKVVHEDDDDDEEERARERFEKIPSLSLLLRLLALSPSLREEEEEAKGARASPFIMIPTTIER